MPDFDVAAVALAAPANPSQLGTYRPVITVRNNGTGVTSATGTVSAYKAGLLVFHSAVQSGVLDPGETGPATAVDPWIITEEGDYTLFGYVTCDRDQVEPNNNLAPAPVVISGHAPPPPEPVTAHAPQHEFNGSDQLNVSGLYGELATPQTAAEHAPTHETGGTDALNVTDLPGQLAEPQTPVAHGNEHHTMPFETATGVAASIALHDHAATAHETNLILERTTHKDQPDGYVGLDSEGKIDPDLVPIPEGIELQANKDQPNGYSGLDNDGLVPGSNLATNEFVQATDYLAADRTWKTSAATPGTDPPITVSPGYVLGEGISTKLARADHSHSASGRVFTNISRGHILAGQAANLCPYSIPGGYTGNLTLKAWGRISTATPVEMQVELHAGPVSPGDDILSQIHILLPELLTDIPILIEAEITNEDLYVDGYCRVSIGTIHAHGLPATSYLDTYYLAYPNNRTPDPLACFIHAALDPVPGADFYIHWQRVDLSRS